jgi:hypothetical protein
VTKITPRTAARPKRQLSRAELKAYEARRAARVAEPSAEAAARPTTASARQRRDEMNRRVNVVDVRREFEVIRADMRRLLIILAVMTVLLIAATIILR